jgi:catechol-2,3-dioxygenase
MIRPGLTFSHFGFFVTDLERMADFYTRVLEFTITDRGFLPGPSGPMEIIFLSRNPDEHHQIVIMRGRPAEISFNIINQISLKADSLDTLKEMYRRVRDSADASDINPITHGNSLSLYVRDPEGNRLEIYIDLPWYVDQPFRIATNLDLPNAVIMAEAEAHARSLPGFKPRAQWRDEMAKRMGL